MSYYIPRLYGFLSRLEANNNREWFKANKAEYDTLRELWLCDIDRMIAAMSEWWPQLRGVSSHNCAYRIYRDTRFSQDKTPLKTFFSAGVSPHGRNAHGAGYYLQLGPGKPGAEIESGLYGGVWCPESEVLKKLRKAIVDNIEEFEDIIHAPGVEEHFPGWYGDTLKTVPKGYDRNHPLAHLLRRKDYGKFHPASDAFFADPSWPLQAAELFGILKPLIDFLDYSIHEEV